MSNSGNQKSAHSGRRVDRWRWPATSAPGRVQRLRRPVGLVPGLARLRAIRPCAPARPITPPRPWRANTRSSPATRRAVRRSIRATGRVAQQVDYQLVRAEMNGLDFDTAGAQALGARSGLLSLARVPSRATRPRTKAPTHYGLIELWTYRFPLAHADEQRLAAELGVIPPLLAQARGNLTGNAHDLWITGTGTMKNQLQDLQDLAAKTGTAGTGLKRAIASASTATAEFIAWLEAQAPTKTGPSGVGKENYTWSQLHVHLVPLTWDEEVTLLRRELARAHASLAFEEQRNRGLPPLARPPRRRGISRARRGRDHQVHGVPQGPGPADHRAVPRSGDARPDRRVRAGSEAQFLPDRQPHYEPMTLFAHFYHWFDHAWMEHAPNASPVHTRSAALQHLGHALGGHGHRDGGTDLARGLLR